MMFRYVGSLLLDGAGGQEAEGRDHVLLMSTFEKGSNDLLVQLATSEGGRVPDQWG